MGNDLSASDPSASTDSAAVKAGKACVRKALQEVARGGSALLWWWGAPEQGSSSVLYVLGDVQRDPISERFSHSVLRGCARGESARLEIRRRLEVLVEKLAPDSRVSSRP